MESILPANPSPALASPGDKLRILALLPIPYSDRGGFWFRDAGLVVATLREMGHDAWLVALPGPDSAETKEPVIQASLTELAQPEWWRAQKPDAVISLMWGASRYAAVRRAALTVTNRFIEKLDTDGIRSPRIWLREYFLTARTQVFDTSRYRWCPPLVWLRALAQTVVLYCFPRILDRRVALCLAELPVVNAESPLAAERIARLIGWWSPTLPRITAIPHPVDERDLVAPAAVPRRQRIVAVGRWDAYQKNFPLLLRTLSAFLKDHPDWDAVIVGGVLERMERHQGLLAAEVRERVKLTGPIPHTELAGHLYGSRILLVTSNHESFHIAAAEALCCGCSVVGPGAIPSMVSFTGSDSGTLAIRRDMVSLCEALGAEVRAWKEGRRDPERIAVHWRGRVGARAVAEQLLSSLPAASGLPHHR
jgi:glycosyltransferase involved in cell wall biosynthesis